MKNKSILQSILTGLFVVLVLAASNSIVRAQCYAPTWNRETGNWDAPINWSPNCVPDDSSDASINNGGSATISDPPQSLRLTHSLKIGDGQNDTGSLTVNGGGGNVPQLNVDGGDFYIGNQGKGILSIVHNVPFPTIFSHSVYIGAQLGSSGTVNVSGSGGGFVWQLVSGSTTLFIGCTANSATGGTAALNLQNYASISIANNSPTIPGIKVGQSGTLNGSGTLALTGYNDVSRTAQVFGTLAPTGALAIEGNLDLTASGASVVCHVTPQAHDEVDVGHSTGGLSGVVTLGGRVTVIVSGTFTPPASFRLLHAEAGRGTTKFASQSIMFNNPPCVSAGISYHDNLDGSSDVNLDIFTSCDDH